MYSKSSTKPLVADAMKHGARYILSIALSLLLRPSVLEAVKAEPDAGSSWSSASMSVIAYSNAVGELLSNSDSWSGSGMQYEGLVQAYQASQSAMCQSSAASSVSVSSSAWSVSPDVNEQSIEGKEIYDIRFYTDCLACPCDQPPPYTTIFAGFNCELNAAGEIVWNLLPSTAEENVGTPVTVYFRQSYSVGGLSGGTVYQFRIYDWVYGVIGKEMEGPYEVVNYATPPDYGSTPEPEWEHLTINASIGDKIVLSYKMEGYGYTQNNLVPSNLTPDGEYPTMGLSLGVWVLPEGAVEISGPNFVVLYQPMEDSPMETLTAQANPPGGAYQWEIIQGQDKAMLFPDPEYGEATKIKGLAPSEPPNDVIVKVTYHSPDGKSAEAKHMLTVRRPSEVSIVHSEPNLHIPPNFVYQIDYWMQVSDQFGDPIMKKGIPWDEEKTYACRKGNKKLLIGDPIDEFTDDKGQFIDQLWLSVKDLKVKGEIPLNYVRKVNQVFKVGGHKLVEGGRFCQTYYKYHAISTPGECPCP